MDYFYPITIILQTKDFDISARCEHIENLKKTMKNIRENIDKEHEIWYKIALDLAKRVDVPEKMPRVYSYMPF